jgi:hypothetical protein
MPRISNVAWGLLPILLLIIFSLRLSGQEPLEVQAQKDTQNATGCLQKGEEPNGFVLIGDDGKAWELTAADSVKLADHVGHKVTVTGSLVHESKMKEEKKEKYEKAESGGKEYADLKVNSVEMISSSCK